MKKYLILSAILIATLLHEINAQPQLFSRVLNGANNEDIQVKNMVVTTNNNYLLVGENWFLTGAMVTSINSEAQSIWSMVYSKSTGNNPHMAFNHLTATHDSCYLASGTIYHDELAQLIPVFVKLTPNGDTVWAKQIVYNHNFYPLSTYLTADSGFIVTGYSTHSAPPYRKLIVAKLNVTGNPEWTKILEIGNNLNAGNAVKQLADNSYVITGTFNNGTSYQEEYAFLLKLSATGQVIWVNQYKNINAPDGTKGTDFIVTDTGFLLLINTNSRFSLLNCNQLGIPSTQQTYSNIDAMNMYDISPKLHPTTQGFVVVFGGYYFSKLISFDSQGEYQWAKELFLLSVDVCVTPNHEYLVYGNGPIFGVKENPDNYAFNIGLIQTDTLGNATDCTFESGLSPTNDTVNTNTTTTLSTPSWGTTEPALLTMTSNSISTEEGCISFFGGVDEQNNHLGLELFPNPTQGPVTLNILQGNTGELKIFNQLGQLIYSKSIHEEKTTIDLSGNPNGLYTYHFWNNTQQFTSGKLLLIH